MRSKNLRLSSPVTDLMRSGRRHTTWLRRWRLSHRGCHVKLERQVSEPHQFATAKDLYRARYFETLDCAVSCLKNRITGKASTVLIAIESLMLAAWKGAPLSREHLDLVHSHYSGDLDRSRLENQLQGIENLNQGSPDQEVHMIHILHCTSKSLCR